jgi:hypothetical protein
VGEFRFGVGGEFGGDPDREYLAEFTPHWSKESISQITPWVNTLCS